MMQLLKRISLLFVAVLVSLSAMAQQREQESKPKQEEKPVLYIFSIPGCSPCKRLHDEALGEPEVTALLRRMEYHPVEMDFTKDAAALYRKHARSGGVPELVLYDRKGEVIARQGYTTFRELVQFLRKAFSAEELKVIDAELKRNGTRY
ncbi:MAG: thioredoxin family protein [Alistipes sp.]|nr:thioredoxin family protein [Alistipes sp.]